MFIIVWIPTFIYGQLSLKEQLQSTQDSIQKFYQNQPVKALDYAFVYEKIAADSDSLKYKAKADNFIGMCYYMNGEIDKAIKYYVSGIQKFETLKDTYFVAMLHNNIGAAYQLRKKPEETIKYYEKALKGFEEVKDTLWMANLYNNISIQKNELGLYQEELDYKQKAMNIYISQKDTQMILLTKGNLAHTYFKLGDYKKSLLNAEDYLYSPYNEAGQSGRATVLLAYAYILQKIGNSSKSLKIIQEAKDIAEKNGFKEISMKAHQHLASLYEEQNNYKQSYAHFKSFHALQDTLFNQQKDETINDLLVKYDSDKKDADIILLNAENELKNLQIAKSNNTKWALILGLLLVSLLAFLAWRLKNIKAKNNIELTSKNEQISKALDEKNILLREIHHRVKNNLQVISSLLKLQSQYIEDEGAVKAIAEGRNRVHSMALLHQNLYKEDNLTGVNMKEYFTNLIEGLFDAYNITDIRLETEIEDLTLDIDTVIPLGLVANELVSNALKHAFENADNGVLSVKLWEEGDRLIFNVKDNGSGYDENLVAEGKKSFGQKLIRSLSDKLEADIHVTSNNGTNVTLSIKDYKKVE
ncbi:MAG TPA: histidine kinase dimerization/phosphoacceptor domain -containing protein [Saprospiraceae bacterium]|nr:histidine kinase dimerization/phosphoacceptor domain -containing protein [Saprospiraceae bacterium]